MASHDPIPAKDADFDTFQEVFINTVTLKMGDWNIPIDAINTITTKQLVWSAKWFIARDRLNSSTSQRTAKDLARKEYVAVLRPFIQTYVYRNALVDDEGVEQCGLRSRDRVRTPVPPPATIPLIDFKPMSGNRLKAYYRQEPDESGSSKRAKPKGVVQIEFVYQKGGTPPVNAKQCTERYIATRSPVIADFEPEDVGTKIYFFARWLNGKGQGGDWSPRYEVAVP